MSHVPDSEQRTGTVTTSRCGSTAILTLDHVRLRNALSPSVQKALLLELRRAKADPEIRSIVLTGAGDHFSAGGDLSTMVVGDVAAARDRLRSPHAIVKTLARLGKPVVAAVEGWAAGAGLSLALACDYIVGSETSRYVASFGKVGLVGDLGLLRQLPLRVGLGTTRRLLFSAKSVDAMDARSMGLIDHLTAPGSVVTAALECAADMEASAPLAIAATKALLAEGLEAFLERERDLQSLLYLSDDHAEGKAAFSEKRAPVFRGR